MRLRFSGRCMQPLVCAFSETRRPWDEVKMGRHFIVPSNAYGYVDGDWYLDSMQKPGCSGWFRRRRRHRKGSKQASDRIEIRIHGSDAARTFALSGRSDHAQRNEPNVQSNLLVRHSPAVNSSASVSSEDDRGTDGSGFSLEANGDGDYWTFKNPGVCSRMARSCDISCGASAHMCSSVTVKPPSEMRHSGECRDQEHTSQEVMFAPM